ncbi:MAG TPA: DNA replication and repair protein RecF [Gemmatimonadaceae bacterium]|nr:DNA replication and repair protein RecF [Gemmatimonadaceae bacterium]
MTLRALEVRDFRNLARVDLPLPPEGIAVVGDNGHGKTSLLEAIYYLHVLRSMRGAHDADVVRFGAPAFHVRAQTSREVGIGYERATKRKRVTLDGVEPARLTDALGAVPSVMFSPADVALVRGAPGERRRFLDIMLGVTSQPYLRSLQAYRAALARRNAALRSGGPVAVWEPPLAHHGAIIWRERAAWVSDSAPALARLAAAIGELGPVGARYSSTLGEASVVDAERALADALAEGRAHDIRRGMTRVGVHRDDLVLSLEGHDLRTFGSAGQQRTVAIALRMLEAETLEKRIGVAPVFLLDDPFAELDVERARRILALLRERGRGQTVLTVPRAGDIPAELTTLERWRARSGAITRDG